MATITTISNGKTTKPQPQAINWLQGAIYTATRSESFAIIDGRMFQSVRRRTKESDTRFVSYIYFLAPVVPPVLIGRADGNGYGPNTEECSEVVRSWIAKHQD